MGFLERLIDGWCRSQATVALSADTTGSLTVALFARLGLFLGFRLFLGFGRAVSYALGFWGPLISIRAKK